MNLKYSIGIFFLFSLGFVLLAGCTTPSALGPIPSLPGSMSLPTAPGTTGTGTTSTGDVTTPPASSPTPDQTGAPSITPEPAPGDSASNGRTPDMAVVQVLQYHQKIRMEQALSRENIIRYDNLSDAFGVRMELTHQDETGQIKTNENTSKIVVWLQSANGERWTLAKQGVDPAIFAKLPVAFWPFDPAAPSYGTSSWAYADASQTLPAGDYTLYVDLNGDGQPDASTKIQVPGIQLQSPRFGSQESANGFDLSWTQAGAPKDYLYRIQLSSRHADSGMLAADEPLDSTTMRVTPSRIDSSSPSLEPGIYLIDLQAENGGDSRIGPQARAYYQSGHSNESIIFGTVTVQEVWLVHFKVGSFCHCDDWFLPEACTIDELTADTRCN